jgi:hypothetical protein
MPHKNEVIFAAAWHDNDLMFCLSTNLSKTIAISVRFSKSLMISRQRLYRAAFTSARACHAGSQTYRQAGFKLFRHKSGTATNSSLRLPQAAFCTMVR